MKKLILLGLLLGLTGCNKGEREHEIICTNPDNKNIVTIDMVVPGDVVAVIVADTPVLSYYDDSHHTQIIRLKDNDCVIY